MINVKIFENRYTRNTESQPNGVIKHCEDCHVYDFHVRNCNCGLLHDLMVFDVIQRLKMYPQFWDDIFNEKKYFDGEL